MKNTRLEMGIFWMDIVLLSSYLLDLSLYRDHILSLTNRYVYIYIYIYIYISGLNVIY